MSHDILLTLIDPDPAQERTSFDAAALAELAQSLAENGQAVAILVRPAPGGRFTIVHGERRFRAARALGWPAIRAEVREMTAEEARWLALAENIQRADLTPTEEARAYQSVLSAGVTQTELARRLGKGQSYIATKLRFLKLPAEAQAALDAGGITEGHAKQLLRLASAEHQAQLTAQTLADGWPVQRLKLEVDARLTPAALEYEVHELGQLFPMLTGREMASMIESIKAKGLLMPITLYEGKILDGKVRYAACQAAGVTPRFRVFPDDFPGQRGSALDYVLGMNLHRASYTEDQRAMIAASLADPLTPAEAAELAEAETRIERGMSELEDLRKRLDLASLDELLEIVARAGGWQDALAELTLRLERQAGARFSQLSQLEEAGG